MVRINGANILPVGRITSPVNQNLMPCTFLYFNREILNLVLLFVVVDEDVTASAYCLWNDTLTEVVSWFL
jgi:hypothetical protein